MVYIYLGIHMFHSLKHVFRYSHVSLIKTWKLNEIEGILCVQEKLEFYFSSIFFQLECTINVKTVFACFHFLVHLNYKCRISIRYNNQQMYSSSSLKGTRTNCLNQGHILLCVFSCPLLLHYLADLAQSTKVSCWMFCA